jgi:FAD/FMN-containing dehydrogenase
MSDTAADAVPASRSSLTDPSGLHEALRTQVRGEVKFDNGSRALYATDGSNYRQVPIGVVLPRDPDDVLAAISVCREFGAPLLCRGGGTSLAGQCCNVAVILDFSKYMGKILEIDPDRRIARVQPGVVLDHLRNAAEKYHLTFAPDPASHDRCTIGGMIGNNSCGVHSIMGGKTDDNIEALEVVTYDGVRLTVGQNLIQAAGSTKARVGADAFVRPASEASAPQFGGPPQPSGDYRPRLPVLSEVEGSGGPEVSGRANERVDQITSSLKQIADQYADLIRQKFPNIPRRVSGYNLNYLLPENGFHVARALVGSEGTCATILEATCRLIKKPPRVLLVLAIRHLSMRRPHPRNPRHKPIGLEGTTTSSPTTSVQRHQHRRSRSTPRGGGWLMVEFGAESIRVPGWASA